MTTPRIPMATATAIQQRITSSAFFDGTFPTGDSPIGADYTIYKYTPQTAGGLFYWNTVEPLVCSQIHVDLGGSADITIKLVNLDPATVNTASPAILAGEEMTIEAATSVAFIALDEARFKTVLLPFQGIQIITTASGAAQIAQVVASLERQFVR
jgi:hypothetical protein